MKINPEDEKATYNKLNQVDLEELKLLVQELTELQTLEVTLDHLLKIENASRALNSFREKYNLRIIHMLQRGWL